MKNIFISKSLIVARLGLVLLLGLWMEMGYAATPPLNQKEALTPQLGEVDKAEVEKVENELKAMIGTRMPQATENGVIERLKKLGWKIGIIGSPGSRWQYEYGSVYKVTAGKIDRRFVEYVLVEDRGKNGEKLDKSRYAPIVGFYPYPYIPKEYKEVLGCHSAVDWDELVRRCKVNKGENCGFSENPDIDRETEAIFFARMPNKCAQRSRDIYPFAYRYSGDPHKGLEAIPVKGMHCIVEDHRDESCEPLMDW